MYDAIDPSSIPSSVPAPDYALGYVDGRWPSYAAMSRRFPTAIPVSISAIPGSPHALNAQGCDGETGDYTPEQAAQFVQKKLAQGRIPFVYCSLAAWDTYRAAVTDPRVDWMIAAYPGNGPNLYPGTVAHQFIDHGTYDESVVIDGWQPGRPITQPTPTPEEKMPVTPVIAFAGTQHVLQASYNTLWHKIYTSSGWKNQPITSPNGGTANISLTIPDQQPQTSVIGSQLLVTVEDNHKIVYYFALGNTPGATWGWNKLP